MNDKGLKLNILKSIVFYNIFDYPLTLVEIQKNVGLGCSLLDINNNLNALINEKIVAGENGFYFLLNRSSIINTRLKRYNYSKRKDGIARRFAGVFSIFPYIRAVYLVNSIGSYNLRNESDIDFLIITSKNRIWLSRLYCAGIAKILNKRPNSKTKKDKICLSFYLSDNNLDFSKFKMRDGDPYFDYWEKNLLLLISKSNVGNQVIGENNLLDNYITDNNYLSKHLKKNNSILLDRLEKISSAFQYMIMPKSLLEASKGADNSGVCLGANVIKLYLKDKRIEIKEKYEQELKKYN